MPSLFITRLKNFPIDSNCYIISHLSSNKCIIVDPSQGSGNNIYNYLKQRDLIAEYIILTHEHFDHISSVEFLRSRFNCKVVSSAACSSNITNPKKNLSLFYDQVGFSCNPADILIEYDNQSIRWLKFELLFILTPGHSNGGICFGIENNIFTGDTIMNGFKPVVKLPGGNLSRLEDSIAKIIETFSPGAHVYPGHGDELKLSEIQASNFTYN